MKTLAIASVASLIGLLSDRSRAQGTPPPPPGKHEISADDAQRDLRILKRSLTDLHPGLTRYTTLAHIDAGFDTAGARHGVDLPR